MVLVNQVILSALAVSFLNVHAAELIEYKTSAVL